VLRHYKDFSQEVIWRQAVYYQFEFFSGFELQVKTACNRACFILHRLCNRNFFIRKLEGILNDVYQVVISSLTLNFKSRPLAIVPVSFGQALQS